MSIIEQADLYYQEGGSDKEYHLQLIEEADGTVMLYRVEFQYGRRGSTLNLGTKIRDATQRDARKVYDRIYGEKYGKGYRPNTAYIYQAPSEGGGGLSASRPFVEAVQGPNTVEGWKPEPASTRTFEPLKRRILWNDSAPVKAQEKSPKATTPAIAPVFNPLRIPQLCNPIDLETNAGWVESLLCDDLWGMQEKKDGKHFMIHSNPFNEVALEVVATNKKGKECACPPSYAGSVICQCLIDGEGIGNIFHAFDLLELRGEDLRGLGYGERFARLRSLESTFGDGIRIVPMATGYEAKKAWYARLKAENKEGVVFKRLSAPFTAGRPAITDRTPLERRGDMIKVKFYAECSVRVKEGRPGKRSVGLEILDNNNKWIDIGNVTIPPNKEVPNIGDIVEIKYLYVAFVGGHLYQPIYKEVRDDIDASECTVKQLKYKANEED